MRPVIEGRFIGQFAIGNFGNGLAVLLHAQFAIACDLADFDRVQPPFAKHAEDLVFSALIGHQQHALLRFRKHDLVRRHAGFALGNAVELDFDTHVAAAAHFAGGAGEAGRAHVLNAHDCAGLHGFEAGFQEQLFQERIAHLHIRPFLLRLLRELGRGHGCAVNAIAAGARAYVNHRVADAGGFRVENVFFAADAQGEHVHQGVAIVAFFEDALAAHRGDAETIAVVGDAGDHAVEDAAIARAGFRIVQTAEAQRIENGDGPRAHGENIAQDAAHARSRSLERLDEAGVVVRFDLEGDDVAIADIDDARVFARPLHHELAARGQLLQVQAGTFIGAVLAPHHAEYAQLRVAGFAAEDGYDLAVLFGRKLVLGDEFGGNGCGQKATAP